MCYLCEKYGDPEIGGGLWYLNPRNHSRNMYKLRPPGTGFKGTEGSPDAEARSGASIEDLIDAMENGDQAAYDSAIEEMTENMQKAGMGAQVLPLADADKVLELCSPVGLMSCRCRKRTRAIDERNELEYTCMGTGVGMLKWERWPEVYKGGVKFVNVDEAKEWNHKMDKRGFVHLLMIWGAPYIGGFCQCDYSACLSAAVDFGHSMGSVMKSHYVAQVDYDICNGCGVCVQRCQFAALRFESTTQKANIDQYKCFGCGLCHTGCPRGAIKLVERASMPALAEVW